MKKVYLIVLFAFALTAPIWAQSDTNPPELVGISFDKTTIDVLTSPDTLVVTLHVTDDLSGVRDGWGIQTGFGNFESGQGAGGEGLALVSGDYLDGVFEIVVHFPQFIASGTWYLSGVYLRDQVGNETFLLPDVLQGRGFPIEITVLSNPDLEPPLPTLVAFDPNPLVAGGTPTPFSFRLGVFDALSGLNRDTDSNPYDPYPEPYYGLCDIGPDGSWFGPLPLMSLRSPSGVHTTYVPGCLRLTEGTPQDGVWEPGLLFPGITTPTIPPFPEAGLWQVDSMYLFDNAGNESFFSAADLAGILGSTPSLEVISAQEDLEPPTLTHFDFYPRLIDTGGSPASVTYEIEAFDNLSGVGAVGANLRSPSGSQRRSLSCWQEQIGVPLSCTADQQFPQYSEQGTWTVERFYVNDHTGNRTELTAGELEAMGFPSTLVVIRPSLDLDGIVDPALGGLVTDETFGDRASVDFPPGILGQATNVSIDVFESPLDLPTPTGFEAPGTYYVNIQLDPEPSYPLPVPGLTVTLPLTDPMAPGTLLSLFYVDPATGLLVEAIGVDSQPVVGMVDSPEGRSATFTGIAHFSILVGLIPDASGPIPVEIDIKPDSTPNTINLGSKGNVPVAVLSTADFDARNVDPTTVTLAGAGVRIKKNGRPQASFEDVNGDGLLDLLLHIKTADLQLGEGDEMAVLRGLTFAGDQVEGFDSIRLVP